MKHPTLCTCSITSHHQPAAHAIYKALLRAQFRNFCCFSHLIRSTEELYFVEMKGCLQHGQQQHCPDAWLAADNDGVVPQEGALGRVAVAELWSALWRAGLSVSRFFFWCQISSCALLPVGIADTVENVGTVWVPQAENTKLALPQKVNFSSGNHDTSQRAEQMSTDRTRHCHEHGTHHKHDTVAQQTKQGHPRVIKTTPTWSARGFQRERVGHFRLARTAKTAVGPLQIERDECRRYVKTQVKERHERFFFFFRNVKQFSMSSNARNNFENTHVPNIIHA